MRRKTRYTVEALVLAGLLAAASKCGPPPENDGYHIQNTLPTLTPTVTREETVPGRVIEEESNLSYPIIAPTTEPEPTVTPTTQPQKRQPHPYWLDLLPGNS